MGLSSFPGGSEGKASACHAGDPGLIPGSGRSPGEGNGDLLPPPPMDWRAWWATVQGVAKSRTWDGPNVACLKLAKKVCPVFNSCFLFIIPCTQGRKREGRKGGREGKRAEEGREGQRKKEERSPYWENSKNKLTHLHEDSQWGIFSSLSPHIWGRGYIVPFKPCCCCC